MVDSSKLFKVLAKYEDKKSNDKSPAKHAAENYDSIFNAHKPNEFQYKKIVETASLIDKLSNNKREDLSNFIQGIVLASPYNLDNFISSVSSATTSKYTDISFAINFWLENEFKQAHPELFTKLNQLSYINTDSSFEIKSSRSPQEIQKFVQKTHSCLTDAPLSFFDEMTKDAGTIYLLAIQKDQKESFQNRTNLFPNAGYVILNAFQSESENPNIKNEPLLSVDTVWINKNENNKKLILSIVESLVELAQHLNVPIIDKGMSSNYLRKCNDLLDVYDQNQNLFKLGHVPKMTRYNSIRIPKINDGYFIIKSIQDCK